jgi:2-haloalkanoic acid dehalogenase type II
MKLTDFDALTFDCYGTIIDWESGIVAALRPWADRHAISADGDALLKAFADAESRRQHEDPGALYSVVLERVFADIADRFGAAVEPQEARAFGRSIRDWPPFPDSPGALAALKRRYKLAIVSNVDRASFRHSNDRLGVSFDLVVTAEDAGAYKPDLRPFQFALERLKEMGVPREKVLHTAQSLFHDHVPAKRLGLTTCWINRRAGKGDGGATPKPSAEVKPDFEFPTLAAMAEAVERQVV